MGLGGSQVRLGDGRLGLPQVELSLLAISGWKSVMGITGWL
jgi:hypothetical protein